MSYVEIIFAPTNQPTLIRTIDYQAGLNVKLAIELSGLQEIYPEIKNYTIGVFKNPVSLDYVLNPKDRVEIYRPLLICPKEKRRKKAKPLKFDLGVI